MDVASVTVEIADYQAACYGDYKHLKSVFHLKDVGIEERIARTRLLNFNVFAGAYYGTVPVLRIATAYDAGRGLCLSQVLSRSDVAPVIGATAIVSPIDATLLDNEKHIALNAFRLATAPQEK